VRRALPLVLVMAIGLLVPAAASAGPTIDAAALAEDCNKDGLVMIDRHGLRVVGGSGVLARDCFISMAPKAEFELRDVRLTGGDVAFVIADAQQFTTVDVSDTEISLGDGGAIQLSPGCCAGEGEPDRGEYNARITVVDSFLRAGTVEVSASTADRNGTVVVKRSILKGVAAWSENPVVVHASVSSTGGKATVTDSQLISVTGIRIATGDLGDTRARRNTFDFTTAVTITTGAGGSCTSSGNTPPTACT
jgi:hypothetical protein